LLYKTAAPTKPAAKAPNATCIPAVGITPPPDDDIDGIASIVDAGGMKTSVVVGVLVLLVLVDVLVRLYSSVRVTN